MQLVINETADMNVKWFTDMVNDAIDKCSKGFQILTAQEIADAVVQAMVDAGEDCYTVDVDRDAISPNRLRDCDVIEVRYFDYNDLDDEVPMICIGVDTKGHIHIGDARPIKQDYSINIY